MGPLAIACSVLVVLIGVQLRSIVRLQSELRGTVQPRGVDPTIVLSEGTRAVAQPAALSRAGGPVQLEFHLVAASAGSEGKVLAQFLDAAGDVSGEVQAIEPIDSFGTYALTVWPPAGHLGCERRGHISV
jgi:hypothetical protein